MVNGWAQKRKILSVGNFRKIPRPFPYAPAGSGIYGIWAELYKLRNNFFLLAECARCCWYWLQFSFSFFYTIYAVCVRWEGPYLQNVYHLQTSYNNDKLYCHFIYQIYIQPSQGKDAAQGNL